MIDINYDHDKIHRLNVNRRGFRKSRTPWIERLEDRTLLDGGGAAPGLPVPIVVGRTLSSYDVPDLQNHQLTITYTVYNQQADPETGVLLTTTLQPGVTYQDASAPPDLNGQVLAWSLGTISGYGRASVQLTVGLPAAAPPQIDGGAEGFATLDARAVNFTTIPATLRAVAPAADLLASTPDANTTDPSVQEKAAELGYAPQAIFDFLQTQIGYNSYQGSLRGARGTLWSGAGNSLDTASLGVALLRASGIPARYAHGSLPLNLIQDLIASMFPSGDKTVGYIPPGTTLAGSGGGSEFSETQDHYWYQFDAGNGFQDADPEIAGSKVGQTFATATDTFNEVADALREKTEVKLNAEFYNAIEAAFGTGGLDTTTVLDQTFNDVDLVGHPLTIGNFVASTTKGFILSVTTNTYSPYIAVGDEANPDSSKDELIRGQDYQEVLTNFPFASRVLTGLFLDMTLSGPGGPSESYERALVDRIGYAVRQNGGSPSVSVASSGPPVLTENDAYTLNVFAGYQPPGADASLLHQLQADQARLPTGSSAAAANPSAGSLLHQTLTDYTRYKALEFADTANLFIQNLSALTSVAAYFDRPRVTLVSARGAGTAGPMFSIDLIRERLRALASPGNNAEAPVAFNLALGYAESFIEGTTFPEIDPSSQPVSTEDIFQAAAAQGIGLVTLTQDDAPLVDTLGVSPDAKARITDALRAGKAVVVPSRSVLLNGTTRAGWYETDPGTGETVGVLDSGGHQEAVEYAILLDAETGVAEILLDEDLVSASVELEKLEIKLSLYQSSNLYQAEASAYGLFQRVKDAKGALLSAIGLSKQGTNFFDELTGDLQKSTGSDAQISGLFGEISSALSALKFLYKFDPPAPNVLSDVGPVRGALPQDASAVAASVTPTAMGGAVSGSASAASLTVANQIAADWDSTGTNGFLVTSLIAGGATVADASGKIVGSGSVTLDSADTLPVSVSGTVHYDVQGYGSLAFYGTPGNGLRASGSWQRYAASLSGGPVLQLATGSLVLNGVLLPAGTYSVSAPSASLKGSGLSTTPDFAGGASVSATSGAVEVGPGAGTVTVAGQVFDAANGLTISGYTGVVMVSPNAGTDTASFNGSAHDVLSVSGSVAALTTVQNTPQTFHFDVRTSLADSFILTAEAPPGWTASVDESGSVTITPPPGLRGGTYPVRLIAQSQADADLLAQAVVLVSLTPALPGLSFAVAPDPFFTVPFHGTQVPTAFLATIHNTETTAETVYLSVTNPPAGFTAQTSVNSVTIPAGDTAEVGIYLIPKGTLPAPATALSFQVFLNDFNDTTLSTNRTVSFAMPTVHGVTLSGNPFALDLPPGVAGSTALTLTNVGNVAETVTLTATTEAGLTAGALSPVSLAPGQSTAVAVTLTPDAATPLNTTLSATIQATYGPSGATTTQTLLIPVLVEVPGTQAIASALGAAAVLGNNGLSRRLTDLGAALTSLVQNPSDPVPRSQGVADLDSLISQVASDPILSTTTAGFTAARGAIAAATTSDDVLKALSNLGQTLATLAKDLNDEAQHGFNVSLSPNRQIALPGTAAVYDVAIQNTGSAGTTYDLTVSGLPAGVSATFSQTTVTLGPGGAIQAGGSNPLTLSLTESGSTLIPADFTVTATPEAAPEIALGASGKLALRNETILVGSVTASPPFTDPGGKVDVTAVLQGVVNEPKQVSTSYTVVDPSGKVLFTSRPVSASFDATTATATVDLGSFDTTGFAKGNDAVVVTVADAAGQLIPGATGRSNVTVGQPVTATLSVSPTVVPLGLQTVTNTLQVNSQATFPDPLTLLGAATTPAPGTSVALDGNLAYESGTGGINIIDVSDPADPKLLRTFGSDAVNHGQFGFNVAKVVQGNLYVATQITLNSYEFQLLVYSLADPENPSLLSNTTVNYSFLSDLLVNSTGTAAFVPTTGISVTLGFVGQNGTFLSLDTHDPSNPKLADVLFNDLGAPSGGVNQEFGGVLVDDQTVYVASTSSEGSDTQTGPGRVLVVNIADPANVSVVRELDIPGTVQVHEVAVHGNRALVVGSTGGTQVDISHIEDSYVSGNVTLTVLDITDPLNPQILGSTLVTEETYPHAESGGKVDAVDLGNGQFAVSDLSLDGNPVVLLIDPTDPNNPVVEARQVPSAVHGVTVAGNTLYASTADGLSIFRIGPLVSIPVTISVKVPNASESVLAGSFDKLPTRIVTGTDSDTLVWDRNFAFGTTAFTFDWRTTLTGLQPGESRDTTLGGAVDFVSQGAPGTLDVPPAAVTAVSVASLSPASQTVRPGDVATFELTLINPTDAQVVYRVDVGGNKLTRLDQNGNITVDPHGTADVPIVLRSDPAAAPGDAAFFVNISASNNEFVGGTVVATAETVEHVPGTVTLAGPPLLPPDPESHGVVVTLDPVQAAAGPLGSAVYSVRVYNTGSVQETFALAITGLSPDFAPFFGDPSNDFPTVIVPPGEGNFREVRLVVPVPVATDPGDLTFKVTATSASLSASADGTLSVLPGGVNVVLDQSTVPPGTTIMATVANTGQTSNTYDLTLGGPAAVVSSLGSAQVTLDPGAEVDVPINVGTINFASPGALNLEVVAASHDDPAVRARASADVTIPTTQGLTATLAPATMVLPGPGPGEFVVTVNNTGNAEDQFRATITGASGPVTATLTGLDGLPTQTITNFRLPGLTTGTIRLHADLSAPGQGTVTVEVQSLSAAGRSATETATLTTTAAPVATTTQVDAQPNPATVGQAVALTATVAPTSGAATPTGSVTFTIDGQTGPAVNLEVVNGRDQVTLTATTLAAGPHTITASYGGDPGFGASQSNSVTETINAMVGVPTSTLIQLSASPRSSTVGQTVTLNAIISPASGAGTPTGAVTFTIDGQSTTPANLQVINGQDRATFAISSLASGMHTITASYAGDSAFAPSRSNSVTETVNAPKVTPTATAIQLTASPSPATTGRTVTLGAAVMPASGAGSPTGTVTFTIDGTPQPPVTLRVSDGAAVADFPVAALGGGTHTIGASYSGDSTFTAAVATPTLTLRIDQAATMTTLVAAPNPSASSQTISLTATVTGNGPTPPTGSVTFFDGATPLGTVPIGDTGTATVTIRSISTNAVARLGTLLNPGAHALTAAYSGDPNNAPSTSNVVAQVVVPSVAAPTVTNIERFGYHKQPTSLVLTFSTPVALSGAQDVANYKIVTIGGRGRGGSHIGHVIPVRLAVYHPASQSVTLYPKERLDVHNTYRLTVNATRQGGLTGSFGTPLAGAGIPGTDYVTEINRHTLVGFMDTSSRARSRQRGVKRLSAVAVDALASSGHLATRGAWISHPFLDHP